MKSSWKINDFYYRIRRQPSIGISYRDNHFFSPQIREQWSLFHFILSIPQKCTINTHTHVDYMYEMAFYLFYLIFTSRIIIMRLFQCQFIHVLVCTLLTSTHTQKKLDHCPLLKFLTQNSFVNVSFGYRQKSRFIIFFFVCNIFITHKEEIFGLYIIIIIIK